MKRSGMFVALHRLVRLLWAELRCEWYLIIRGMWYGECKFCGWHKDDGRLSFIASTTGSIFDGTLAVKRVFWNEHEPNAELSGGIPSAPVACALPPCDKCGKAQAELGGIEYGPPRQIEGLPGMWCRKLHVCVACTAAPNNCTRDIVNAAAERQR